MSGTEEGEVLTGRESCEGKESWPELQLPEQVQVWYHMKGYTFSAWPVAKMPWELWKDRHRAASRLQAVGILKGCQNPLQGWGGGGQRDV